MFQTRGAKKGIRRRPGFPPCAGADRPPEAAPGPASKPKRAMVSANRSPAVPLVLEEQDGLLHQGQDLLLAGKHVVHGLSPGRERLPHRPTPDRPCKPLTYWSAAWKGHLPTQRPQWLQAAGSMTTLPSSRWATWMGQFFFIWQTLQPRHFSRSTTGSRWPTMPTSLSPASGSCWGQPPTAILNLWGSFT